MFFFAPVADFGKEFEPNNTASLFGEMALPLGDAVSFILTQLIGDKISWEWPRDFQY